MSDRPDHVENSGELAIPLHSEIRGLMERFRQLHGALIGFAGQLERHMLDNFVSGKDSEVALYELWIRSSSELLSDMQTALNGLSDLSTKRISHMLMSRESDGFIAFGRRFIIDADLLPTAPKKGSEESAALLSWLKSGQYAGLVEEKIHWAGLKKIVEELAEKGEPPPPGINKLSPRLKIRVSKVSS